MGPKNSVRNNSLTPPGCCESPSQQPSPPEVFWGVALPPLRDVSLALEALAIGERFILSSISSLLLVFKQAEDILERRIAASSCVDVSDVFLYVRLQSFISLVKKL